MRKGCIEIILKQDSVVINIDENTEQKKIVETLKKKMIELKKLYQILALRT